MKHASLKRPWHIALRPVLRMALVLPLLAACAVSPVTGERKLQFYGSSWEKQVGATMYSPLRQSQGGDFILDPVLTQYVQGVGQRLAAESRRQDGLQYEFSVINSSVPNAWALPGGKIVVNRGLLTQLDSEAALAAVLGHEVIHADAAHGAQQQSKGMLAQIGAVASMVVLGSTVENAAAREIAMLVPTAGLQLVMQKQGRDAEREADEYGMRYMSQAGYDPQGAVTLQETFIKLEENGQSDWLSGLFASHPPSRERLENNRTTAAQLTAGGEWGKDEYQRATAFVRKVQPAYEAYDKARKAVSENQLRQAQELLGRALALEPRESHFHALQGDIFALQGEQKKALGAFDKAVGANGGFFYGYLRRGQVVYALGRGAAARTDLTRSLELLPTAEAYYLMGLLERDAGNTTAAVKYFQLAGQGNSEDSVKARKEQIRLDIGLNPAQYVAAQSALDDSGRVWVQFANRTDVALRNIQITYSWLNERGETVKDQRMYKGPLAARAQDRIELDLKFTDAQQLKNRFRASISAAAIAE